jgi:protein-glutamine gamma-glutamyltransferase
MNRENSPAKPELSALRRHFEISLYLLLLTGVLALVSTGKLDLVSILVSPAALLLKGYRWWRGRGPELSNRVGTWLTIAYFAFFPFDLWFVSRMLSSDAMNPALFAALLAAIHLMLFATIVRLYSASTTRDYLFLTLMAFTAILASAILTVDTAFLVFLVLFLALAVSTFVGLEMWRSAQGTVAQPIESGTPAARRLHNSLGMTSAGIAVGSVALGSLIFLFLPRVSAGYLSGFNLQPTLISGFSDDVELGEIGEIKKSSAVVMRIRMQGGLDAGRGLHWRGIGLTQFDGKRWYNEAHEPTTLMAGPEGWFRLRPSDAASRRPGKSIKYTILLEPIASTALFFTNEADSVRGRFNGESGEGIQAPRPSYLLEDLTGSVLNPYHNFARLEYETRSVLPTPTPAGLRRAGTDYPASVPALYLQLPPLDPRIPALAKQITGRAETPYDKTAAIEGYLRSHYGYTLDLTGRPPKDPLAYFLFDKRAGHCEYFAAAMTVLLRTLGIPARYVNGFLTGEYNDVGGDFVIRASDAHSWVEVYFPSFGWLTFDPTPPAKDEPEGIFSGLGHYWDWFELQWSEWVVNYDFAHQYTLAQNLHRASLDWSDRISTTFTRAKRGVTDWLEFWQYRLLRTAHPLPKGLAIFGALVAMILLLHPKTRGRLVTLWRLRVSRPASLTPHLASLQYHEMLRLLARRGLRKAAGQTPLEFAASVADVNLALPVQELTSIYHEVRFGGRNSDLQRTSPLLEQIQSLIHKR